MTNRDTVTVYPCTRVSGNVRVPGDKSISHRVVILSALATGTSEIRGILQSEDCMCTVKALEAMGAGYVVQDDIIRITGTGGRLQQPDHALDLGNSGTGIRLLAGLVAGHPMTTEMTGDESLRSRPMGRIKEPLELMGAKVDLLGKDGCAPIRIRGGHLHGIDYAMPVASAQVKSCILLASLFCEGTTRVRELLLTRDHTERLFRDMGIPLTIEGMNISLDGFGEKGPELSSRSWVVPGDFSSAASWLVTASAMKNSKVSVQEVGLNPSRTALMDVLRRMGAVIHVAPDSSTLSIEPCGKIEVQGGRLSGTEVGGSEIPRMIDELPLVAVAGALADGITVIKDARELRVKESDRIACMAANLKLLGVELEEKDDGLVIQGGAQIRGHKRLNSYGDHRVAMAMVVLGLFADAPVTIDRVACVNTSYPDFWKHLRSLGAHVEFHCDH